MSTAEPLLRINSVSKQFRLDGGWLSGRRVLRALDDVSLTVEKGETLGIVGESGCGKSTLGRIIVGLETPSSGNLAFEGRPLKGLDRGKAERRDLQCVFQDPYSSLDPRMTAFRIIAEPLTNYHIANGIELRRLVLELLDKVGLRREQADCLPHQFSGGQRQRIAIARALALRPKLVVCDEPVSALDVSVRAQIINLMRDLQVEFGFAYLFISHDVAVVEHISHRIGVMYLGRLVELGGRAALLESPRHPYTRALLVAVPTLDPASFRRETTVLAGDVPSAIGPPSGCHFHTRCALAVQRCAETAPVLREVGQGHRVACHLAE